MKRLGIWILPLAFVLLTSSWILPYIREAFMSPSSDDLQSKFGLLILVQASPFFDGTNAPSFVTFFEKVKQHYPARVGDPRSANPFPGLLPKNRVYARVLELPKDFCALDPASTPLMWDTRPQPNGNIPVLFMDGQPRVYRNVEELEQALEIIRSNGGTLWLGTDDGYRGF